MKKRLENLLEEERTRVQNEIDSLTCQIVEMLVRLDALNILLGN